jgi:hypothetical protein
MSSVFFIADAVGQCLPKRFAGFGDLEPGCPVAVCGIEQLFHELPANGSRALGATGDLKAVAREVIGQRHRCIPALLHVAQLCGNGRIHTHPVVTEQTADPRGKRCVVSERSPRFHSLKPSGWIEQM